MSVNIDVNTIPKNELYWAKEKVCDMAFTAENRYKKAKTEKSRNKWSDTLIKVLDVQSEFEIRLRHEFGYSYWRKFFLTNWVFFDIINIKISGWFIIIKKSNNVITVYHGTTYLFNEIDVAKGKPYKDFGRGFYVTENPNHAKNLALRNRKIEAEHYNRNVDAYLYTFEFDLMSAKNEFDVKEYKEADIIWMKFVLANRKVR